MNKKQYKIKFQNGKITPLEPIQFDSEMEGVAIFYDADDKLFLNDNSNVQTVSQEILELAELISEEELKKLPNDLSINLDHYLYGSPKNDL